MDINGLNSTSSQYQNSMQNAPDVSVESDSQSPQLQSNASPFDTSGNATSSETTSQLTQVLQSLLGSISGALSKMQSIESAQSSSQGASSGDPDNTSLASQRPSNSQSVNDPGDGSQSPNVQPQAPGPQAPTPQSRNEPSQGSGQEGGAGGAGGQDQGGMIKLAQILQSVLGSLLGAIPFLGSALSSLTARIGASAHNN